MDPIISFIAIVKIPKRILTNIWLIFKMGHWVQFAIPVSFPAGSCERRGWMGITASNSFACWKALLPVLVILTDCCELVSMETSHALAYFQAAFPVSVLKDVQVENFFFKKRNIKPHINHFIVEEKKELQNQNRGKKYWMCVSCQ